MIRIKSRNISSRKNKQNNLNNYEKNTFKLTLENWHFQIWELRIEKLTWEFIPKVFLFKLMSGLVFYCVLQYSRRSEGYSPWKREIVRVKASRRAALNDTNGVRTGAHDAEWEAGLSLSLPLSHRVSSFMDFFIVVLVDRNSCTAGIRIFNVGVPVWILN